jgi:molecular chaperone GrpE
MAEETVGRDDESAETQPDSGQPAVQPADADGKRTPRPQREDDDSASAPENGDETPETEKAELIRERDQYHDKWLRAVAELDNLRKRTRRELADSRKFAVADLVRSLLSIQDDFERALATEADRNDDSEDVDFRAGVALIYQNFRTALTECGVRRIEAQDRAFDPALHEAVGQLEQSDVPSGTVIEVVQHGYTLDGLVLRPSRVIVSQGGE